MTLYTKTVSCLRTIRYAIAIAFLAVFYWTTPASAQIDHNSPWPPHKIIDNVYYVGTGHISVYLITTPEGHVLVNTGFESTVPFIRESVEALGFSFQDIKIILASHWHHDHQEGDALAKEITGAEVVVLKGDVPGALTVRPGGKPHPIDRIVTDGDKVKLGGTTLIAQASPGHTKGTTNWLMKVQENGKKYNLLISGSYGVNEYYVLIENPEYLNIVEDNRKTYEMAKKLPVDVFLAAHPPFYDMFRKYQKLLARKPGDPNPFIEENRESYLKYVLTTEQHFEAKLLAEQIKKDPTLVDRLTGMKPVR